MWHDAETDGVKLKWKYEPETGRTVFRFGKKMFYCDPGDVEPTPDTIWFAAMWFRLHERA